MNKYFIVIDMENDFVTGSLANKDAEAIIPLIKEKIKEYKEKGYNIIFTRDTHFDNYLETNEGKHLPIKHCIKGTKGWEIVPELNSTPEAKVIDKFHFGYDKWNEIIKPGDEVVMCGTVTSICVAANASIIKTIEGVEVSVIANCCADLTKENHEAALKVMAAQHVNIIY